MWLHFNTFEKWRELQWSMSWLRPGGKINKALIPGLSYNFGLLYCRNAKHQGAL